MSADNLTDLSHKEGSLAEKCQELGELLQLDGPVEQRVLLAALENETYATNLLISKGVPEYMELLLRTPPSLQQTVSPGDESKAEQKGEYTQADLVKRASKSLYSWAQTGFRKVPWEILEKREAACLACPNLTEPTHILQKMSTSSTIKNETGKRAGNKACKICGCAVKNKMKVATDTCPQEAPNNPGYNRWGEPHVTVELSHNEIK
jgi:hypothetical protein